MIEERTFHSISTNNQDLVAELLRFTTFKELRHSHFYQQNHARISALLDEPRMYRCENARPRLRSFLRVVEWNIQRGSRLKGIIEVLDRHPVIGYADLMLINELDEGMVRSGNLNIALELSRALSVHTIFCAEYLELTKGVDEELALEGENTTALHGNAILTRHSFSNVAVIRLPRCENNFESKERRIGGRIGIITNLDIGANSILIGNTHLDVVNTPRCRAKQMRAMLTAMNARLNTKQGEHAALVGGDLNTHTFARGTRLRAMKNTATILGSNRDTLNRRLMDPETRESAIRELASFGYETDRLNDGRATSRTIVSSLAFHVR